MVAPSGYAVAHRPFESINTTLDTVRYHVRY